MKLRTFSMFLKSRQDKVSHPVFPWPLKLKPFPSSSRLFRISTGLLDGRCHVKSAWEVSVENAQMECPWGWGRQPLSEGSSVCFCSAAGAARRPAPGQAAPKRQDEGLYNGSPWIMLLKKGATRNKSLCILSHNCRQKNPHDSSLWY